MSVELSLVLGTILVGMVVGFTLLYWLLSKKLRVDDGASHTILEKWLQTNQADLKSELKHLQQILGQSQTVMHQSLKQSDKHITDTLQQSYVELNKRMDMAAKVIGDLKEETGKFSEIGRSMKELQHFLRSPKLRGNLGEQILHELLSQMLPKQAFHLQYRFNSGDVVDALIMTQAGKIPIDAKFPLENFIKMTQSETEAEQTTYKRHFDRDVRKHIKDISQKYVRTDEGTIDFAVMYVPSESIYYEIMSHSPEVYDYAQQSRVLPVSPATFYAFLRTILMSYEGQRIAEEAQTILRNLRDIQKATVDFGEKLTTLNRHITNAYNNVQSLGSDYNTLHSKIENTNRLGSQVAKEIES